MKKLKIFFAISLMLGNVGLLLQEPLTVKAAEEATDEELSNDEAEVVSEEAEEEDTRIIPKGVTIGAVKG